MKFRKWFDSIVTTVLLGLALVTLGAEPPPPPNTPPVPKVEVESLPLQPATAIFNSATARELPLPQPNVELSLKPVITRTLPLTSVVTAEYDGQELKFITPEREMQPLGQVSASSQTTVILSENFEAP